MRRIKGQNITEFAIIIALVAIAGILALVFLGDEIKKMFGNSSAKVASFEPFGKKGDSGIPQGGSLGGSADKPVSQCSDNMCIIDFGEFVLTNVPNNFNQFVESEGTHGGTQNVSDLLLQIARQMESKGQTDEAQLIRKMSVTAHNIASMQKYAEEAIKKCDMNDYVCISNLAKSGFPSQIDGIDNTFYNFKYGNYEFHSLISTTSLGRLRTKEATEMDVPYGYKDQLENVAPAATFIRDYDLAMGPDSKLSDTTKAILKELYWDTGMLTEDFYVNFGYIFQKCGLPTADPATCEDGRWYADPFTGNCKSASQYGVKDEGEDFYNYRSSKIAHYDASLICASGNRYDSGVKCH